MARLNDMAHGRLDAPRLDPREIVIREGFNYRDTASEAAQRHIAWLKESIRENGVQEPIRVEYKAGTIFLVNGECRLLALRQLWDEGLEVFVPAIVAKGDEAEILAKSMIANGSLPPTPLEFGAGASRLLGYGWSVKKVAEYTPPHIRGSKAQAVRYVKEAVELHEAPLAVKRQVREGVEGVEISTALALHATRKNPLHAEEEIAAAASQAKSRGQKVAKRPKGAGIASKRREEAFSQQEQLLGLGDRMAQLIAAAGDKASPALSGAAQAWTQLRGK